MFAQKRYQEASEAIRPAIALRNNLPNKPGFRTALVADYWRLFRTLRELGQLLEAEEACRQRVAIGEKIAVDFPAALEHRPQLGWSYGDLASQLRQRGQIEDAANVSRKAVEVFEKLAKEFPDHADYRQALESNRKKLTGLLNTKESALESQSK